MLAGARRVDDATDPDLARIRLLMEKVRLARERLAMLIRRIEATREVLEERTIAVRDYSNRTYVTTRDGKRRH
jgi:hypothetical protein